MDRLVYLSIGGADGADVIKVLQNTEIQYGILLEYDSEFCNKARTEAKYLMPGKEMIVIEGDAFANRKKVNEILRNLLRTDVIDGVVITGFSVFHELPDRSTSESYDFRTFILQLVEGLEHVYFYSKEPCKFSEWTGRVEISINPYFSNDNLYEFSLIIQQKLGKSNSAQFNQPIIKLKDSIELSAELATEVVKKIVYFLLDGDEDKLLYELQESHAKFSLEKFSGQVSSIFSTSTKQFDTDINTIYETTGTFRKIYEASGIRVRSVDNMFVDSIVPNGFVVVKAFFRPVKRLKIVQKSFWKPAKTEKEVVHAFFKSIEEKKYTVAFNLLNKNLKANRWNNEISRFTDGYHNLIYQKLISMSPVETYMGKGWLVYLQADLNAYTSKNVTVVEDIIRNGISTVNFDQLNQRVELCRNFVLDCNGDIDRFNNIPLFRFLHPNFIDDVRWITKISTKQAEQCFALQRIAIHSCYNVFCQEENNDWRITKLSPINFNGLPLR